MRRMHWFLGVRGKIFILFSSMFLVIFIAAYLWLYSIATQSTMQVITEELQALLVETAEQIDGDEFEALAREGLPRSDGYTDDPRYWEHVEWLDRVHQLVPQALLYTYIPVPGNSNQVMFIGSNGALWEPQQGAKFKTLWTVRPDRTMLQGLDEVAIYSQRYSDQYGIWGISGYAPIRNSKNEVVGGLGIDFKATYVTKMQQSTLGIVLPLLIVSFLFLLAADLYLANQITVPLVFLERLSTQIGEGRYTLPQPKWSSWFIQDEIGVLTNSLIQTANRVREREQSLRSQIEKLKWALEDHLEGRLELGDLVDLLIRQVLPVLQATQSVLIARGPDGRIEVLMQVGVNAADLPEEKALNRLMDSNERRDEVRQNNSDLPPWIAIALPLKVSGKMIGVWLLGERTVHGSFDDEEVHLLRSFATQIAVALAHIQQTELLHNLYSQSIQERENERKLLANEIHDSILSRMATLSLRANESAPELVPLCSEVSEGLRQTIYSLRPPLLDHGLRAALEGWVDETSDAFDDSVNITLELSGENERYPVKVEEHVFRIVQQAINNAQIHAQAHQIRVTGSLEPGRISLSIADDGIGFNEERTNRLSDLLRQGHIGLVSMHERATLIGASIHVYSKPEQGTRVYLSWEDNDTWSTKT